MIPRDKAVEIAKGLLQKTKEGKVEWQKDSAPNKAFRFQSQQFSFFLNYVSPRTEPDFIVLELMGPRGESVGEWKAEEGDKDWPLASELYAEVSRSVLGWDKILEEVEKFIAAR